jgi:multisubunit Na+/H+ antiporter MnhE subunit
LLFCTFSTFLCLSFFNILSPYPLAFSIWVIIFSSFSFSSRVIGYVLSLCVRQLIPANLCSLGWQVSLWISVSVAVGFLCVPYDNLLSSPVIVMSGKLIYIYFPGPL